jgi:putative oligomerization/nucleic acid binding protein
VGVINTDQKSIYLTDIRDVRFHKPFLAAGSIIIETAGGHSIEGLPAASNGASVRDRLMAMVHWARQRNQQPAQGAASARTVAAPDKFDQLRKLAELKAAGALTEEEFQAEKAKLLGQ